MSFYEGGADYGTKSTMPAGDYTDSVIDITRCLSGSKRDMIQQFAMQTRVPIEVVQAAAKYPCGGSCSDSDWKLHRFSAYRDDYKAALVAGFVIDDIANITKFFAELDSQGSLKIVDIKSLEYSIFAFNDKADHWTSLKKSVRDFNNCRDDLYHIELTYNKKPFGIIVSSYHTKVGKLGYSDDRNKSLKEYWFPKIDQYFHAENVRNQDKSVIVLDFVEQCRTNVKARQKAEANNEL